MEEIKKLWVSIIIFGMFIAGGLFVIQQFQADDPTYGHDDTLGQSQMFQRSFDKLDVINEQVSILNSSSSEAPGQTPDLGFLDNLVMKSWNTLTSMYNSISFMYTAISDTSAVFNIPMWFTGGLISIIIILIVFAIYKAIFQVG